MELDPTVGRLYCFYRVMIELYHDNQPRRARSFRSSKYMCCFVHIEYTITIMARY